jgi:YD repeat-containing protein
MSETYSYDANGNMITRVEGGQTYNQVFDAENRLISVTVSGQTTQFTYDGDSHLVKKTKPDGSRTIYVGGIYEVDKNSGGTVTKTTVYYPAGGAMRVNGTLYYILKDHLGSANVITDTSGNTVGEARYYPYGETRFTTGTMQTDQLFTGQREMAGLGIYHYGARFPRSAPVAERRGYSPKLGRFLSADSDVPNMANPQAFNRYSYVLGHPLQ